jgi:NAD(P)-dependent dehydrogenase (short-subunit alcohol dehydrogenase family)
MKQEGKEYNEWLAYAQSKTGNVLFTAALAEKLKSKGVQSFALQPGCMQSSSLPIQPHLVINSQ